MVTNKQVVTQPLRCGLFAFVLSTVFVLMLALVAKMVVIDEGMLPIINQVLKAVSVGIAVVVGCRENKLFFKALIVAFVYCLLNSILFILLGGQLNFATIGIDFGVALAISVVMCIFKSRKN